MVFNSESVLYRACDIVPYLFKVCKRRVPDEMSANIPYEDVKASDATPVFVQYGSKDISICYATIVRDKDAFDEAKRFSHYEIFILDSEKAEAMFKPKISKLEKVRAKTQETPVQQLELALA